MFSRIRRRFTYANVTMTLALVFAMSGGAYAASKYLITSTKQISPKVLKQLKGKQGPAGKDGASGANGANGKDGAPGLPGEKGTAGLNGTDGTSVTSTGFSGSKGSCTEGGSEFTAAEGNKTYACNGKEGSPWTAGGKLPSEKTETGTWSFSAGPKGAVIAQIPFALPLETALTEAQVHYVQSAGNGSTCPGSSAKPEAEPGNLCVYQTFAQNVKFSGTLAEATIVDASTALTGPAIGAATTGAVVVFEKQGEEEPLGYGTWATTAP